MDTVQGTRDLERGRPRPRDFAPSTHRAEMDTVAGGFKVAGVAAEPAALYNEPCDPCWKNYQDHPKAASGSDDFAQFSPDQMQRSRNVMLLVWLLWSQTEGVVPLERGRPRPRDFAPARTALRWTQSQAVCVGRAKLTMRVAVHQAESVCWCA